MCEVKGAASSVYASYHKVLETGTRWWQGCGETVAGAMSGLCRRVLTSNMLSGARQLNPPTPDSQRNPQGTPGRKKYLAESSDPTHTTHTPVAAWTPSLPLTCSKPGLGSEHPFHATPPVSAVRSRKGHSRGAQQAETALPATQLHRWGPLKVVPGQHRASGRSYEALLMFVARALPRIARDPHGSWARSS